MTFIIGMSNILQEKDNAWERPWPKQNCSYFLLVFFTSSKSVQRLRENRRVKIMPWESLSFHNLLSSSSKPEYNNKYSWDNNNIIDTGFLGLAGVHGGKCDTPSTETVLPCPVVMYKLK